MTDVTNRGGIIVATDVELRHELRAKALAETVGPDLATTYPNYRWRVEAHPHRIRGFVDIILEHVSGRHAYTLICNEYPTASLWKAAVLKAGGELLERAQLSRRGFDEAEYRAAPRNFAGMLILDTA